MAGADFPRYVYAALVVSVILMLWAFVAPQTFGGHKTPAKIAGTVSAGVLGVMVGTGWGSGWFQPSPDKPLPQHADERRVRFAEPQDSSG